MATESTGSDPARILELLWRPETTQRSSKPGPKPQLDLARIVRTAMRIANQDGLDSVSMRRVGADLGVGTATLYTYVPGRSDLLALMLDTIAGLSMLPHRFPGGWRAQFEAWAREDWTILCQHPWAVEIDSARILPGPNGMAWYDSALRVLAETGLSEQEKIAAIQTLDSYVRGSVWSTTARPDGSETTQAMTDTKNWLQQRDDAMTRLIDFTAYPAIVRSVTAGANLQASHNFELGLSLILDGVAKLIERRDSDIDKHR